MVVMGETHDLGAQRYEKDCGRGLQGSAVLQETNTGHRQVL
jgi:hypothetical protein